MEETMTIIFERAEMRNREQVFQDRNGAGERLAQMLSERYGDASDVVILTIPMGGVPVALKIKKALNAVLDLVIVRKLQIPGNTEAGFGAVTIEGDVFINEPLLHRLQLSGERVQQEITKVKQTLEKRNRLLRGDLPFPDLEGKSVIMVDDGLASGYTMRAGIHMVAKRNAAKIVVAVPTAPQRTIDTLDNVVDEIYCPNIREQLSFSVAAAYVDWHDLSEEEVKVSFTPFLPQSIIP